MGKAEFTSADEFVEVMDRTFQMMSDDPDMGPAPLRTVLRRLHADDRIVAWDDVLRIDRAPVTVVLRHGA